MINSTGHRTVPWGTPQDNIYKIIPSTRSNPLSLQLGVNHCNMLPPNHSLIEYNLGNVIDPTGSTELHSLCLLFFKISG